MFFSFVDETIYKEYIIIMLFELGEHSCMIEKHNLR